MKNVKYLISLGSKLISTRIKRAAVIERSRKNAMRVKNISRNGRETVVERRGGTKEVEE